MGRASNFRARQNNPVIAQGQPREAFMPRTAEPWRRREEVVALERSQVGDDRQIVDRRQGSGSCAKFITGVANLSMEPNPQRPGQAQLLAGSTSQKQRRVLSMAAGPVVGGGTTSEERRPIAETSAPTGQPWSPTCSHSNAHTHSHAHPHTRPHLH